MKRKPLGKKRKNQVHRFSMYRPGEEWNNQMDAFRVAIWKEREVTRAAKRLYDVINRLFLKEHSVLYQEMKYNESPFSEAFYKVRWIDALDHFKLDYNLMENDFD